MSGTVSSPQGVPIAYEAVGSGEPAVVLVHGWSCDRSYWREQVEPLSRDFKVVTLDLHGHGESGKGSDPWTIASFGDDVAAVVTHLELEEVVLVGHSMGGDVVVEAARRIPNRVAGLVWVDTYQQLPISRTAAEVQELVEPFRTDFAGTTDSVIRGKFPEGADRELVQRVASDMAAAPADVAVASLVSSFTHAAEISADLEELQLPVIAINPEEPPTDTDSMARYGVEVMLVPGVGHFMMMEAPEAFNRVLREAISKL